MDVLIKNLKMPIGERKVVLVLKSDGEVSVYEDKHGLVRFTEAIELPPHGDLCDKDELMDEVDSTYMWEQAVRKVRLAPVIVEASDGIDN